MLSKRVGCAVIVDADDRARPVGIVTENGLRGDGRSDPVHVLPWPKLFGKYVRSEESMEEIYALARSRTAESIMSTPMLAVDEHEDLWAAVYLAGAGLGRVSPPTFVYAIYGSIFAFFNVFALNMALQYRRVGPWRDHLFGQRVYILLSLTATSAFACQVFAGTLRPV
jgi:Heliorhodopsin